MAKKQQAGIADEVKELIALTAEETASRVYMENVSGQVNYYRIVEKLLYNYKRLEALVRNEEEYLTVELHGRSKSVTVYSASGGGTYKCADDIAEEVARERLANYERTASNFREVEKVLDLFRARKEFIVIRMYYFGEDADGNERTDNAPQYTWEQIALELSERGILRDEKTARRWRNNIINDIAVCMFGKPAAISTGVFRGKNL